MRNSQRGWSASWRARWTRPTPRGANNSERTSSLRVDKLAHTPPVPWLQNNEWPVCNDDFAVYNGELTRDQLLLEHEGAGPAKAALRAMVEEVKPEWELDEEALDTAWDQLGNFVAVFAFRCPGNPKPLYVLQTA